MRIRSIRGACAVFLTVTLAASSAFAAPIPSSPGDEPDPRAADEIAVQDFLARDDVTAALADLGLTAEQIESRLAELSDDDVRHLASNLDQIRAAGEQVPEYIWWLLGGLLGVLILAAIF